LHSSNPVLDEQCCRSIDKATDSLDDAIQHLMTGQINIATLKLIIEHTDEMREICTVVARSGRPFAIPATTTDVSPTDVLQTVLTWRESEMQQIENRKKDIQNMLGMMDNITSGK